VRTPQSHHLLAPPWCYWSRVARQTSTMLATAYSGLGAAPALKVSQPGGDIHTTVSRLPLQQSGAQLLQRGAHPFAQCTVQGSSRGGDGPEGHAPLVHAGTTLAAARGGGGGAAAAAAGPTGSSVSSRNNGLRGKTHCCYAPPPPPPPMKPIPCSLACCCCSALGCTLEYI
jgi:hypothetical protein